MTRRRFVVWILALASLSLGLGLLAPDALAKKKTGGPAGTYDEGRLDPSWFGDETLVFAQNDEIDYLWVSEGFAIDGKSFHFEDWPEPVFLGEDGAGRDQDDRDLARQMNSTIADLFAREWGEAWAKKGATTSRESGEIAVEGRIVDCSTGNAAAKFWVGMGAGAGSTVVDVKLVDKTSGKLLVAMHHRVVSGTTLSTTDSKFRKWIRKVGDEVANEGFADLYAKGDRVKK